MRGRTPALRTHAAFALTAAVAGLALAANASGAADTLGKTTLEQRIVPTPTEDFRNLSSGRASPTSSASSRSATAQAGRAERRRSLLYLGQLSDFQLADEESPARVEFIDYGPFGAAWRPWEAMNPQIDDAMIRQLNALRQAQPGRGRRRLAPRDGPRRSTPATSPTASSSTRPSGCGR